MSEIPSEFREYSSAIKSIQREIQENPQIRKEISKDPVAFITKRNIPADIARKMIEHDQVDCVWVSIPLWGEPGPDEPC